MKHWENWMDLFSIGFGAVAAFTKGLKNKMHIRSLFISVFIGGVLAWGSIGVLALFFPDVNMKIFGMVSFCAGWVANEFTDKLDIFIDDAYDWVSKKLFNSKPKAK